MARGNSPIVTFRISPLQLAVVTEEIKKHNEQPTKEPFSFTSFVCAALNEFCRKRRSGRRKGRIRRNRAEPVSVTSE